MVLGRNNISRIEIADAEFKAARVRSGLMIAEDV